MAATIPYGNLIISTGAKTAGAALTVLNDFSLTGGSFNGGGFTHTIGGDWVMTGGAFTNQGTIVLNGIDTQRVRSTGAFNNLTVNKAAGPVIQTGNNKVLTNLSFVDGTITLGNFDFVVDTNATITNANDTNYVIATGAGSLVQHVLNGGNKMYPVGNATAYLPATIALTAGSLRDNISVRVMSGVYSGGMTGTPVTAGVVNNTWLITEGIAGVTNATVTLRWPASLEVAGFTRNAAKLAHYTGGVWDVGPTLVASGSNPYTLTRFTGITNFSPFIVSGASQPLPLTWISIDGRCHQGSHYLEWAVGNESDNDYFEIEYSLNGKDYAKIGRVSSTNSPSHLYSFVNKPVKQVAHYYRVRQTDVGGRYSYSRVIVIQPCGDISGGVRVMNNPARDVVMLGIDAARNTVARVRIIDIQGRVIVNRTLQVKAGSDQYPVEIDGIPSGNYYLDYADETGNKLTKDFVIQ